MTVRCPGCGRRFDETHLPSMPGVRALCPGCGQPMELPATTLPFMSAAEVRTLESPSSGAQALSPDKRYSVAVLQGKGRGQVFTIEKPRVTIGRAQCDINLDDPEISRQHALLSVHGTEATIEDLDSTNGTFVGDRRVQQAELDNRSEFRVGHHQLMFVVSDRGADF